MSRILMSILFAMAIAPVHAQVAPFPASFTTRDIATNGVTIHVRTGGKGPAVVLLHGYGETGDMWAPLAADLARDHTVIVPDLRGLGLSSKPAGGFDKKTQAVDVAGVMDVLKVARADLVTHDIGNMVGFAFAALHPQRVSRFVLIDAPVPGVGPWEEILKNPLLWHFRFGGADMERLVAGRERIYLDRFWNEFSATPARFTEASRQHYARLYALPGAMHSGFSQFAAFDQDAIDNRAMLEKGKLTMPVLAVGGEKSFGPMMATVMRFAATDVTEAVVADSGHWIMEENPKGTTAIVRAFLDSAKGTQARLTPREITALPAISAGAGTSGIGGIRTTILYGDPSSPGPYTIALQVPPNTRIAAHNHRDERVAVVVSGTWNFGYGDVNTNAATKALSPGSFYTEPADVMHFARTDGEPAVVYIFGNGPTDTKYADAAADPRKP
jgi:pimeloyl-ACP methyl ester carboxylesterase/quercetin dioxygenase-like cupin family protein